jgi:tRNA threonylcarbamoyl adenosine modification protein YjeE
MLWQQAQSSAMARHHNTRCQRLQGVMYKDYQSFRHTLSLVDIAATDKLGRRIARELRTGDCVAMEGDLGAGKTTLARAILRELGIREVVPSPTFTLVQTYDAERLTVHHYDFYRIENEHEIGELGFDDALNEGAVLVEWPERAEGILPIATTLRVKLEPAGETTRQAHVSGPDRWAEAFRGIAINVG